MRVRSWTEQAEMPVPPTGRILSRRLDRVLVCPGACDVARVGVISHHLWVSYRQGGEPEQRNGGVLGEHRLAYLAICRILLRLVKRAHRVHGVAVNVDILIPVIPGTPGEEVSGKPGKHGRVR